MAKTIRAFTVPRQGVGIKKFSRRFAVGRPNTGTDSTNNPSIEVDDQRKHTVRWTTAEGTLLFDAYDGEILRTAALRRGIVSPHNGKATLINCRGLGTCGTCAVEIDDGAVAPTERNTREQLRLNFPPHNAELQSPRLRLACQVQVRGDIDVTKRSGFWGQYECLSPSSGHEMYFGELEFLLDNKSPEEVRS